MSAPARVQAQSGPPRQYHFNFFFNLLPRLIWWGGELNSIAKTDEHIQIALLYSMLLPGSLRPHSFCSGLQPSHAYIYIFYLKKQSQQLYFTFLDNEIYAIFSMLAALQPS